MRRIVVAADSFKGSVSSRQVGEAVRRGVRSVWPGCAVDCIPVGDGGEGTVEAIIDALGGEMVAVEVDGPLMERHTARYGLAGGVAVMEMAAASGLTLVPQEQRDPLLTTTVGTGQMVLDAIGRGCRDFLICIGGSATNDAGVGMLHALGFRFLDAEGRDAWQGGSALGRIERVDASEVPAAVRESRFTVACDVRNPFYGPEGAACVFGPQKGADAAAVAELDAGLRHFAELTLRATGIDLQAIAGSGAAGGLGGGMVAWLGATLKPGIEMVLDAIDFDRRIAGADLVITGEGRLDAQTVMGKTPYGVMLRARTCGIPTVALGGSVAETDALIEAGFAAVMPVLPYPVSLERAMDTDFTMNNIARTAGQICRLTQL